MTIAFKCPKCGCLCGFSGHHAGRTATCTTCQQRFIIPSRSGQQPQKVKPDRGEPVPGFYREVFVRSWKTFFKPSGITGLIFVAAAVTFKFFMRDADYSFTVPGNYVVHLPIGWIVTITAWGCLCWYYMEIIRDAAIDEDELPGIDIGAGFSFVWSVFVSIYLFVVALIVAQLPFMIAAVVLRKIGIESSGLSCTLTLAGLLSFPMVILILTTGPQLWMVLRVDYIWTPIIKAFRPYLIVAGLVVLAGVLQWLTVAYSQVPGSDRGVAGLHLAGHLGAQVVVIISMRSIGLFYRHYSCYMMW
ncbi:MAG: hypothetical protein ACYTFK_08300 [Planctomycetota bacterium]|jgi:hypothetical protein